MNVSQWAHIAWAKHPNGVGITVPADELHVLLSRVQELEGLALAVENRIRVEVSVGEVKCGPQTAKSPEPAEADPGRGVSDADDR